MGRVRDVKAIVTKDFKRAGNRLLLLGRYDANVLGGTVYADSLGQRGDRLFDAYDAISMQVQWDYLLELHARRHYVSASAVAEGGLLLRLFEGAFGSGLGARVDLHGIPPLGAMASSSVSLSGHACLRCCRTSKFPHAWQEFRISFLATSPLSRA